MILMKWLEVLLSVSPQFHSVFAQTASTMLPSF
jgi:hypothetical protein